MPAFSRPQQEESALEEESKDSLAREFSLQGSLGGRGLKGWRVWFSQYNGSIISNVMVYYA
jgi:hypothetical protein